MTGMILLDKPKGITSFSAVSAIKRLCHEKRVGHTGTLDPMATGVLPILIGRPTVLSSLMLDSDKKYIAKIRLGIKTDTDDITGEIIEEKPVNVDSDLLLSCLQKFIGKSKQIPPMFSAIKKDGVRLYKLAREGKSLELDAREIEIFSLSLLEDLKNCEFTVEAHVSKGTYIRALARDIGEYLGCGAVLCELKRINASGFDIADCVKLEDLTEENISRFLQSEEKAVMHLEELNVTENQARRFCNGGQLDFQRLKHNFSEENQLFRVKFDGKFLGIGFADLERKQLGIKCIVNYPE